MTNTLAYDRILRIDADVVMKSCFEIQNVRLISLFVDVLNRHFRIEVFIELRVALFVMPYQALRVRSISTSFSYFLKTL